MISAEMDVYSFCECEFKPEKGLGLIKDLRTNKFLIKYKCENKAGVDLEQVKIDKFDDKIIVKLPYTEIKYYKLNNDAVELYELKNGIFPEKTKRDEMNEAYKKAEIELSKIDSEKLLNTADNKVRNLIEGIIKSIDANLKVDFEFFDKDENNSESSNN